jgi:hypothetical protein
MKSQLSLLVAVLGGITFCVPSIAQEPEIHWHESYAEALEQAKATGKPMLIQFR